MDAVILLFIIKKSYCCCVAKYFTSLILLRDIAYHVESFFTNKEVAGNGYIYIDACMDNVFENVPITRRAYNDNVFENVPVTRGLQINLVRTQTCYILLSSRCTYVVNK